MEEQSKEPLARPTGDDVFQQQSQIQWQDWLPPAWLQPPIAGRLWVTCYRVLRLGGDGLASGWKMAEVGEVRALLLRGTVKYVSFGNPIVAVDDTGSITVTYSPEQQELSGAFLLLATPLNATEGEPAARRDINAAAGLFGVAQGRNIVYARLYDMEVDIHGDQESYPSPAFENPLAFQRPDVSDSHLDIVHRVAGYIAGLRGKKKARFLLSLQWFDQAMHTGGGIDAWLKYWIALEALAMPGPTGRKALAQSLSRSYGMDEHNADQRFGVEKLYNFRFQIIHKGRLPPVHANLLSYMEALYADILLEHVGLPPKYRAASVLAQPGFSLAEYLQVPR